MKKDDGNQKEKKRILMIVLGLIGVSILIGMIFLPLVVQKVSFLEPLFDFKSGVGSGSEWLGYYSNIVGGIIGAVVAFTIVKLQFKEEDDKEKEDLRKFLDYFKKIYLENIRSSLIELKNELDLQIHKFNVTNGLHANGYVEQPEEANMRKTVLYEFIAFPYVDLVKIHYIDELSSLRKIGEINDEYCLHYSKVTSVLKMIEDIREDNNRWMSTYHEACSKYYLDPIDKDTGFIEYSNKISRENRDVLKKLRDEIEAILQEDIECLRREDASK